MSEFDFTAMFLDFVGKYWNVLTILLICNGLFLTMRNRGVQYRRLGFLFTSTSRYLKIKKAAKKSADGTQKEGVSSVATFFTALATMIGSGNILGVSAAIFLGGPGAIFWMWLVCTINMAAAVTESTLGQYFKKRSTLERDKFIGGPAYYIKYGLGKRWLAIIFALAIMANMVAFNGLQTSFLASYLNQAFSTQHMITGSIIALLFIAVVFWGIRSIASAASYMVPIGSGFYICLAIFILITNITVIPSALYTIFSMAFGFGQAGGGFVGYMIMRSMNQGTRRGLYSNEAGLGTLPNIAAASDARHPAQEGFVMMFAVFIDTVVVCTCTALIIMTSGIDVTVDPATSDFGSGGSLLFYAAIKAHLAWLGVGELPNFIMAFVLFFFMFTSLIGNYYVGENNQRFFKDTNLAKRTYQIIHVLVILSFSVVKPLLVVNMVDFIMGTSATVNMIAIFLLSKKAAEIIGDYEKQLNSGVEIPTFKEKLPLVE